MSTEETQNYTTRSIRDEVNEKDGLTVSFHGITMYMPNKHTLSEKVANCILIRKSSSTARQEKQEMILQEVRLAQYVDCVWWKELYAFRRA